MMESYAGILLFLFSIAAGFLGSLLGIGGGIIIVPALTLLMKIPVHQAVAVSLVSVIATSIAGAHSYVEQKITDIRLGMFLEVSTTLGALFGAVLALFISGWLLLILFGILVFSMSVFSYITRSHDERIKYDEDDRLSPMEKWLDLKGEYNDAAMGKTLHYRVKRPILGSFLSFFAGLGSGMLGIGGGVIKVAAMNAIMNIPMKVAVATSKFMIGVTAATGSLIYFMSGSVNNSLVAPVALGTMLGAGLGSRIMNKMKSKVIKIIFSLLNAYLSYKMIEKGLVQGNIL